MDDFLRRWWVPKAYIGEYKPLFAANSLTLSRLAGYVVPGAAALFGICTLRTWARDKRPNAIGVDISLALGFSNLAHPNTNLFVQDIVR